MEQYVNVVIPPLFEAYTYQVPLQIERQVQIGDRVIVPLGARKASGFVVEKHHLRPRSKTDKEFIIKEIDGSARIYRCFNSADLDFFKWVAAYYGDNLASVIDAAVPESPPQRFKTYIACRNKGAGENLRGKTQRAVFELLEARGKPVAYEEVLKLVKGSAAAVKKLISEGVCESIKEEIVDQHINAGGVPDWTKDSVDLTAEQNDAVSFTWNKIKTAEPSVILLHGVTGSGKTEVYIECIKQCAAAGKGALVLVPEIALTPQLIDRFRARLGNNLAVLHSALPRRVRWDSWRALLEGRNLIAIGARSAVFAPVPNLGLIVVDEEHDASYKQNEGLRYNARDLAIVRGRFSSCPVLLGSATPSLESYANAHAGKYRYTSLPFRPDRSTQLKIEIVDLNRVKPWEMPSKNISPHLARDLEETLAAGRQAFILYNRRGFATYLQCDKCQSVIECPNCSVSMTYHRRTNMLLCHYCNSTQVPPKFCPACAAWPESADAPGLLTQRGAGTEKVFEELQKLFPEAAIDRLDRDAAADIEQYRGILERVRSKQTQILVGTQMIAKGHDIPDVTLVGVVDCDVGLHMPDFRAGEKVFQLLTQAAGRAGRDQFSGKVVLQSRVPAHLSLAATAAQNFAKFAEVELANRKALQYPPYVRLLRVVALSSAKEEPARVLQLLKAHARQAADRQGLKPVLLGPAAAPIERIKAKWRAHMLIKSNSVKTLQILRQAMQQVKAPKSVRIVFDIDPQEML